MPFYSSVDQLLRDRSELARKGIARGRSVVVLTYTGRGLANGYAQLLGTSFVEQQKPYEVELCLAEVGPDPGSDQLYRITYDGSITDEPQFVVMGGTTEPISAKLKETYRSGLELGEAIGIAVEGLQAASTGNGGTPEVLGVGALEVAVLDRPRPRRTFRRIAGRVLLD